MRIARPLLARRAMIALAALGLLSACDGETAPPVASVSYRPPPSRISPPPRRMAPRPPARVLSLPGLEGVIGASAAELARQFGAPRLDVWEGDARKQQFAGTACILDIYLYPSAPGREPQATYIDARRATDSRDVDRAACIAALRRP